MVYRAYLQLYKSKTNSGLQLPNSIAVRSEPLIWDGLYWDSTKQQRKFDGRPTKEELPSIKKEEESAPSRKKENVIEEVETVYKICKNLKANMSTN